MSYSNMKTISIQKVLTICHNCPFYDEECASANLEYLEAGVQPCGSMVRADIFVEVVPVTSSE